MQVVTQIASALFALFVPLVPAGATPQTPGSGWADVKALPVGTRLVVYPRRAVQRMRVRVRGTPIVRQLTPVAGQWVEIRGELVEVDENELVIAPQFGSAEHWIVLREDVDRILQIKVGDDGIENGLLLGAGIGAGSWLGFGLGDSDLNETSPLGLTLGAAVGALIGAIADDLRESETTVLVYAAPRRSELRDADTIVDPATMCRHWRTTLRYHKMTLWGCPGSTARRWRRSLRRSFAPMWPGQMSRSS